MKFQLQCQPLQLVLTNYPQTAAAHFNATWGFRCTTVPPRHVQTGEQKENSLVHTTDECVQWKQTREYGEHRSRTVCLLFMWIQKYRPHDFKTHRRVFNAIQTSSIDSTKKKNAPTHLPNVYPVNEVTRLYITRWKPQSAIYRSPLTSQTHGHTAARAIRASDRAQELFAAGEGHTYVLFLFPPHVQTICKCLLLPPAVEKGPKSPQTCSKSNWGAESRWKYSQTIKCQKLALNPESFTSSAIRYFSYIITLLI